MPSPDVRAYVDLTIFDRSPTELVDRALLDAGAKFPGWVPRVGNTEVVLAESLALIVAEDVYAANRLPAGILEVLLRLMGLTRSDGLAPTTTIKVTVVDAAGYTIPAGTVFRLDTGGDEPLLFATNVDLVIAPAATFGNVAATATRATSEANGTAIGTDVALVTSAFAVQAAELAAVVAGGADPEGTDDFLNRAIVRLDRLSSSLVLPAHFTAYVLEDPAVGRAFVVDNNDPSTGAGADPGHVTVVVADQGGAALSAPVMLELENEMEALAHAGLAVHVIAPTVTAVAVTSTVLRQAGYTSAAVQANVVAALDAYLSPATWAWGATVYRNELLALLDGVEGVERVVSLTVPAADVALAGTGPLADLGATAITVNAP